MLKVLTAASNPVEQSLLLARLSDAGIPCMRGAGGARAALGSGRDILVEEEDLARAQEILKKDDECFDEEELVRLSEEAGGKTTKAIPSLPQPAPRDQTGLPTPVEAQVRGKTRGLLKAFERLTIDKDETNSPFGR
jgi:hypothetical protein